MQSREIEKLQRRWQDNPLGLTFAPLAEAYRKEGMFADALALLEIGLSQHPHYVPAHIVKGRCLMDTREDARAETAFRAVLDLDPENAIALQGLADLAERGGRYQQAVEWLDRLLEFDRSNEDAATQRRDLKSRLLMPTPGMVRLDAAPDQPPSAPGGEPKPADDRVQILQPGQSHVPVQPYRPLDLGSGPILVARHNDSEALIPERATGLGQTRGFGADSLTLESRTPTPAPHPFAPQVGFEPSEPGGGPPSQPESTEAKAAEPAPVVPEPPLSEVRRTAETRLPRHYTIDPHEPEIHQPVAEPAEPDATEGPATESAAESAEPAPSSPVPEGVASEAPESVTAEPPTRELLTPEPLPPEPLAPEPRIPELGVPEPIGFEPSGSEPSGSEPSGSEPITVAPNADEPSAAEPIASEGKGAEPVPSEPIAPADAIAVESAPTEAIEPEVIALASHPVEAVEPEAVEPEAVEPEAVDPEVVSPETTAAEAIAAEPIATDLIATEPIAPDAVTPEAVGPEALEPVVEAEVPIAEPAGDQVHSIATEITHGGAESFAPLDEVDQVGAVLLPEPSLTAAEPVPSPAETEPVAPGLEAAPIESEIPEPEPIEAEAEPLTSGAPLPPEPVTTANEAEQEAAIGGSDLVVTETMAEIFIRQGHRELALAVLSQLLTRDPDNARVRDAAQRLEAELRPAGAGSSLPAYAAAMTGGQSVRSFFESLLSSARPGTSARASGLSLGAVFGDEGRADPALRAAEPPVGESFDQFFAGPAEPAPVESPRAAAEVGADPVEDLEEFNNWLRGLKR